MIPTTMDYRHASHDAVFSRRSAAKDRSPAVRWVKEWVPQEIMLTGKKSYLLKWVREDTLNVLKEKYKEPEPEEPNPEPTTEILYLCSYQGCNKSFPNEGAYRKHSHIHGERQYACSYPGCQKKFLDSSKLKRHQVVHTGVKEFKCPAEGCGKAFNVLSNLRAHMRTHSQDQYFKCNYPDCDKRYTQENKLKNHMKVHQEKNDAVGMMKRTPPADKFHMAVKAPPAIPGSGFSLRPFICNYPGCWKDYIHEYKLKLHFKSAHPGYNPEDHSRHVDEASNQDAYIAAGVKKRHKPSLIHEKPPAKVAHPRGSLSTLNNINSIKKPWPIHEMHDEDSEETEEEEEEENVRDDRWRYHGVNGDDDETEDDN